MKNLIITGLLLTTAFSAVAQKYATRTGRVTFFSTTPVENIEAFNNESSAAIDSKTGDVVFIVPIKSFKFEKALMQEHFNDNYMESDKFPKAEFKGKGDFSKMDFTKDGTYKTNVSGKLTIHGVTKDVSVPGTIQVKAGKAIVNTKFKVKLADYGIKIASVAKGKIAEQVEITVNSTLDKK